MSERERIEIARSRHEKLARQIEESPLNNPVREVLLLRLKVANHAGFAAVNREFEKELERYRANHLPSYRPRLSFSPRPTRSSASFAAAMSGVTANSAGAFG